MQLQKWVSLMIILMLIQITKALGEMVSLHFSFTFAQCIIFNLTNHGKIILIANVSLKTFYSRLGFTVIKDFVNSTTFEAARRQFHYETGKSKADQTKTIGLQCLYTIPRRVTFLHDYRINFNTQKNVIRDLDGNSYIL